MGEELMMGSASWAKAKVLALAETDGRKLIMVACPYPHKGNEAVRAYQDPEDEDVLWCSICDRTIARIPFGALGYKR